MKFPREIGSGLLLGLFGLFGAGLLTSIWQATAEQIADQERRATLRSLAQILNPDSHDNDLLQSRIELSPDERLETQQTTLVYIARKQDTPVAVAFNIVTHDGYTGAIRMLIGVDYSGIVTGVRIVAHKETPGRGDGIDQARSDWILGFDGRSLSNPTPERWAVRKDGGEFDGFTGATVSPRAVVGAVRRTLTYFADQRDNLFVQIPPVISQAPSGEASQDE